VQLVEDYTQCGLPWAWTWGQWWLYFCPLVKLCAPVCISVSSSNFVL
jgi:hypothetical protein